MKQNFVASQLMPFIGRETELNEVVGMLGKPDCQLVTLVASGGSGKTRLAIEIAQRSSAQFARGVYFVPLQSVDSIDFVESAIAEELNFPFHGAEPARAQLVDFLRDQQLLLVLDNFEHLLDAADLLSAILVNAPGVKILVTSREAVNLREEWIYSVRGMSYPEDESTDCDLATCSAVQLFGEQARRIWHDFSLEAERQHVIRICRFVEGMPLALELAASWLKTLSCAEIADEIERSVDFLETNLRNIPERHRSMHAVFDQSWHFLTGKEQDVFKRLSVFRGGFRREAAEEVAGATLGVLSVLMDKSLLRRDAAGRYQMHELLRQYAQEKLDHDETETVNTLNTYANYYAGFLHQRHDDIFGGRQIEAVVEIDPELENLRVAWLRNVSQGDGENMLKMIVSITYFFEYRSRYMDAVELWEKALPALRQKTLEGTLGAAVAEMLTFLAWGYIRIGRLDEAQTTFDEAIALFQQLNVRHRSGLGNDPIGGLAVLAMIYGNYQEAHELAEQTLETGKARQDVAGIAVAYYTLTSAAQALGDFEQAGFYADQASDVSHESGNLWFKAYCLNEQGNVARAVGRLDEAQRYYQESYDIRQKFYDAEGMAVALNHLARTAILQSDYTTAESLYKESLDLYRKVGDRGGLATTQEGLGDAYRALGQHRTAAEYFLLALQTTFDAQLINQTLSILVGVGELLLEIGEHERGIELLTLAQIHPASDQVTKNRAAASQQGYQTKIAPDVLESGIQRGKVAYLDGVAYTIQEKLKQIAGESLSQQPVMRDVSTQAGANAALIDPLSARELEILELIAAGLTNQEIATELTVVVGTVKAHNHNIFSKLGVNNRTQAVSRARTLKLLVN